MSTYSLFFLDTKMHDTRFFFDGMTTLFTVEYMQQITLIHIEVGK